MSSHYVINVSIAGKHYFRIVLEHETQESAVRLAQEVQTKWPECHVTLTFWNVQGTSVQM